MNSYDDLLEMNWKRFSSKLRKNCSLVDDSNVIYNGRKFYSAHNPPFIASVVKVSDTIWKFLHLIQSDLEISDRRQTFFHSNYFHITLNEFGWEDQVDINQIVRKIRKITMNISPFKIHVSGINCFDRIIYAQIFDKNSILESIFNKTLQNFPDITQHFPNYIPHISIIKVTTSEAQKLIQIIEDKYRNIDIGYMEVKEIQLVAARPYLTVGRIKKIAGISLR